MRTVHRIAGYMNRTTIIALTWTVVLIGCSGKRGENDKPVGSNDTAKTGDSTQQLASSRPLRELSYEERQGAFLYEKYCAICHGHEGRGDGFNAFNLDPRPRDFADSAYMKALSDEQIVQTISGGGRSVNKSPLMPAYGWTFNKRQIHDLSLYVRTFEGGE